MVWLGSNPAMSNPLGNPMSNHTIELLQSAPRRPLDEVAKVRIGFTPMVASRGPRTQPNLQDTSTPTDASDHLISDPYHLSREIIVIQPSTINQDGRINWDRIDRATIPSSQNIESHRLTPGSVLLCLRGDIRVAALTPEVLEHEQGDTPEPLPITASTAWAVIDPDHRRLNYQYLAWQLNQPSTIARLQSQKKGTLLNYIPLQAVKEWELPVPNLDAQQAVARIASLVDRLRILEQTRAELLRKYITGCLPRQRSKHALRQPANS